MPQYVTRVVVTELAPDELSTEPFLVEWTVEVRGRTREGRHRHDSRAAARRHVSGLLADMRPGMTRDQVLAVVQRRD